MKEGRDLQERLGRWKAEASDAYIRTTRLVVETFQIEFARKVRDGRENRDWLDEESIFNDLRGFSLRLGHEELEVEAMLDRLKFFGAESGEVPNGRNAIVGESASEGGDTEVATIGELLPGESDTEEVLGGYVVSEVGRRRVRCLHHIARCWRLPGTDYANYTFYGDEAPPPGAYDKVCKDC